MNVTRRLSEEELQLDAPIAEAVLVLREAGIETFESCSGESGHSFGEPTIRFYGDRCVGFLALSVAFTNGIKVDSIRRVWPVIDAEPTNPYWEMLIYPAAEDMRSISS